MFFLSLFGSYYFSYFFLVCLLYSLSSFVVVLFSISLFFCCSDSAGLLSCSPASPPPFRRPASLHSWCVPPLIPCQPSACCTAVCSFRILSSLLSPLFCCPGFLSAVSLLFSCCYVFSCCSVVLLLTLLSCVLSAVSLLFWFRVVLSSPAVLSSYFPP